jgi:MFS family permease
MLFITAGIALQMTSFVVIVPLFARRFTQLGAGVAALGASEMAYALAATIAAPFMGSLADRFGRRPVVLGSLAVYVGAFTGYLLATSAYQFIFLRGLAGALTAGLMPAAMGMVADLAPTEGRAQWLGVLSGGASIGWIAGPILGGWLYDNWGYATALLVAIGIAAAALLITALGANETGPASAPRSTLQGPEAAPKAPDMRQLLRSAPSLVKATSSTLIIVLLTYLSVMFAWAFVEPRFMFFAYDDLGWSSAMLGLVMSTYGVAMMLGEFGLGRLSDRLGRKPVIAVGLLLFSAQFLGLALSRHYMVIAVTFVIAGLGNALYDPALSASILDLAPEAHRGRLLGVKSTAGSIGSILGPALVVFLQPSFPASAVFLLASGIVLVTLLAVVVVPHARPGPAIELAARAN